MESIHARIKRRRLALNLSMTRLAQQIGVSWQTIQQWEKEDGTGTA
ncbi:MAG: helix-turn-helix domain-containing protein, partial [Burkholderiaceae bacterium]